ncbi:efflux transporter outer membrane subunit [Brenneria populi subsp. brevivirga]|uniref:efflux transporter outer membrane subunit n=1 Tax=Brenneria populi TaxID=1505588 RepID=UPI002E16E779|nr:efflux transporter outer membrane subunit [Brenneria populi subsp. brevivirga]
MRKRLFILIPVLFNLTACNLQPRYERPAMPISGAWNYDAQRGKGAEAADIAWQTFFADATLKQLVALSLKNNRDLKVAVLNIESARAQYRIERAALLPTIEASGSQTSAHLPGNLYSTQSTGPVTYQQYEANLGVTSWELDFFGRLRSLKAQALENYLSTEATAQATQISLISEVVSSYLTLCADKDLLQLANDTAKSQRETYDLTKQRYEMDISNEQDLAQAETGLRSAEAEVYQYTRQVQQDANALRLLLGTELPANLVENATLNKAWRFPELPGGISSEVLTKRPDIIAAEHTLKAANANIGAARAAFFPTISLTASGGSASESLGHLLEGGTAAWSFVPSISVPIFDGGKNQANLDVAQVSKRIEIANYEKAIQQAFQEVSDALAGQSTYQHELAARQRDTAANQRYYDLADNRYREGVDGYLNVLVAQRSLFQAKKTEISTRLSEITQHVTLYKVLGGGWKA